jgi:hypothetical protein
MNLKDAQAKAAAALKSGRYSETSVEKADGAQGRSTADGEWRVVGRRTDDHRVTERVR